MSTLRFYDSHAHIDMLQDPPQLIASRALAAGVSKILIISSDPESLPKAPVLATQMQQRYTTGIHPHHAQELTSEIFDQIKQYTPQAAAIGEIGLDYFYVQSEKTVQIKMFEEQLDWAQKNNKPVVIHAREAEDDVFQILKNFSGLRGVTHCFTGNIEQALKIASLGFFIGITGIVTFKKAANVQELAQKLPLSQILIETDSPYLAPIPHRGKINEPMWVPLVAQKIAEIKQLPLEEVAEVTYQNALTLFG